MNAVVETVAGGSHAAFIAHPDIATDLILKAATLPNPQFDIASSEFCESGMKADHLWMTPRPLDVGDVIEGAARATS
jgi:hypothetical protein